MLKIKSDVLYVRNPDTKVFEPVAAIRGADGIVENLSAFSTSETGDSTYLLMTQKGATDILSSLMNGDYAVAHAAGADFASHATEAGHASKADHAATATEAATANEALYAYNTDHVDNADKANKVSVWTDYNYDENLPVALVDDSGYVYTNVALSYNPKTKTLTVDKIAGKATEAETAQKLNSPPAFGALGKQIFLTAGTKTSDNFTVPYAEEANSASKVSIGNDESYRFARPIPFVDGITGELLQHSSGLSYTPKTKTLNVENVAGTASFANALDFSTIRSTIISGGTGDLPSLEVGNMYLLLDRNYTGLYYHRGGGYDNAIVAFGPYYGLRINTSSGKPRIGITDIEADTMASYSTTLYFINLGKIAITEG